MPLTDTALRNAKPQTKPYKLADGGGLFLLVQPSGVSGGAISIVMEVRKSCWRWASTPTPASPRYGSATRKPARR